MRAHGTALACCLVASAATALDRLGPDWRWHTPVGLQGELDQGVLHGSVFIRGSGDPSRVQERVWLLLQYLQAAGVRAIEAEDGRRYGLVAIVNDPRASAARPALHALVRWTARRYGSEPVAQNL